MLYFSSVNSNLKPPFRRFEAVMLPPWNMTAKQVNINTAYLYLNILQESESMAITLLRLTRSSRKFQLG